MDLATPILQCAYLPVDSILQAGGKPDDQRLGTVCFSPWLPQTMAAIPGQPVVGVPMPAIHVAGPSHAPSATGATCEIWSAGGAAVYGRHQDVHFGYTGELLFGAIQLSEAQFADAATAGAGGTPLQQAAEAAYRAIFAAADATGFTHILRFWNYLADINGESHGIERYRQFNMGRQDGFLHSGRAVSGQAVPPASALGFAAGPLTVYFLAGRGVTSTVIENPRQVSAYAYPRQYGPRSPTFSRASVAHLASNDVLFLSGTASIVGHRTLHAGDVRAQVRETMANIAAMVSEANRVAQRNRFALHELCYKVYVRHESDAGAILDELRRTLGESARLLFLKADICREDLLMEIEASAGHPLDFSPGV